MLQAHNRAFVSVEFADREGNRRPTALWFPFDLPIATLRTGMDIYIAGFQQISDAYIAGWRVEHRFSTDEPGNAAADSDVMRHLGLFYTNGVIYDRLWIPSGRRSLLETTGPYANIRLDAQRPEVTALLLSLQDVLAELVTPEGDTFPTQFVAGGIAL